MTGTPDFSHLAAMKVTGSSEAEFVFTELEGDPSLICLPATPENSAYYNASIRESAREADRLQRKAKSGGKRKTELLATPEELEQRRDDDRVIIAEHCVTGWGTPPLNASGEPAAFSKEACLAFLRAIPNHYFDRLGRWIMNPENFVKRDHLSVAQSEALGEP